MIELGQEVKDKVTGFTGIAIAKLEFLNGCLQFCVQPKMKSNNADRPDGKYLDVEQLDVVSGSKKIKLNERDEPSGGIRMMPTSRNTS